MNKLHQAKSMWLRFRQAHAVVGFFASRGAGEAIAEAADQMAQRMAAQGVTTEQRDIREQDESANADAEVTIEPAGLPDVMREQQKKNQREIQKVAVDILEDQREGALAPIGLCAVRRRRRTEDRPRTLCSRRRGSSSR
jgi:cytosine/adenosine deaminase-related metal-dependent hydrolase